MSKLKRLSHIALGLGIFLGILALFPLQGQAVAPDPPTDVTADGSYGKVVLSWVKSVGTVYYNIYCNDGSSGWDDPKYMYIDPDENFTDYDVTVGQIYWYRIAAGNEAYEESEPSLPAVSVTVYAEPSPEQDSPTWDPDEPLEEVDGAIVIKWLSAADAEEGITYYSIYRTNSPEAWGSARYHYIYETEYTDTDVEPYVTYYYRLTATSPGNESDATGAKSITTSGDAGYLPKPPENLVANPGNRQVELDWDESWTSGVTYSVYRTIEGEPWSTTATYSYIYQTSFTDTSVENGITYYYRVTAVNENGESSPVYSPPITPSGSGNIVDPGTEPVDYPAPTPSIDTGCFIATATYGSALQEEVQILSEFRDRYLLKNKVGLVLVKVYYYLSPPVAEIISRNEFLKTLIRVMLKPLVKLIGFITE